jgi:ureidoacrylate peracid hydrolase
MFRNYQVVFLSDATGTFDYPDVGQGAMSAADVHKATLTILAFSTADVLSVEQFKERVTGAARQVAATKAALAAVIREFLTRRPISKVGRRFVLN